MDILMLDVLTSVSIRPFSRHLELLLRELHQTIRHAQQQESDNDAQHEYGAVANEANKDHVVGGSRCLEVGAVEWDQGWMMGLLAGDRGEEEGEGSVEKDIVFRSNCGGG